MLWVLVLGSVVSTYGTPAPENFPATYDGNDTENSGSALSPSWTVFLAAVSATLVLLLYIGGLHLLGFDLLTDVSVSDSETTTFTPW